MIDRNVLLRKQTLLKTSGSLFRWRWSELGSAERADIEARDSTTDHQRHAFLLDRHFRANGTAYALIGPVRAEEACPPEQPLVKSIHATPSSNWRDSSKNRAGRPVTASDRL